MPKALWAAGPEPDSLPESRPQAPDLERTVSQAGFPMKLSPRHMLLASLSSAVQSQESRTERKDEEGRKGERADGREGVLRLTWSCNKCGWLLFSLSAILL